MGLIGRRSSECRSVTVATELVALELQHGAAGAIPTSGNMTRRLLDLLRILTAPSACNLLSAYVMHRKICAALPETSQQ